MHLIVINTACFFFCLLELLPAKKLKNCRSAQKESRALLRYKDYLKSYYNYNASVSDDKLAITPCTSFLQLSLVKSSKQSHKSVLEIDKMWLSYYTLLVGPPGFGKSTLCWELCKKWDTLKSLQKYNIVLQLKLRESRVQNATELNEICLSRITEEGISSNPSKISRTPSPSHSSTLSTTLWQSFLSL